MLAPPLRRAVAEGVHVAVCDLTRSDGFLACRWYAVIGAEVLRALGQAAAPQAGRSIVVSGRALRAVRHAGGRSLGTPVPAQTAATVAAVTADATPRHAWVGVDAPGGPWVVDLSIVPALWRPTAQLGKRYVFHPEPEFTRAFAYFAADHAAEVATGTVAALASVIPVAVRGLDAYSLARLCERLYLAGEHLPGLAIAAWERRGPG